MVGIFGFACDVRGYLGSRVRVKVVSIHGTYAMCRTADKHDRGRMLAVEITKITIEEETQWLSEQEASSIKAAQKSRRAGKVA